MFVELSIKYHNEEILTQVTLIPKHLAEMNKLAMNWSTVIQLLMMLLGY